jgi:hypothetical protein
MRWITVLIVIAAVVALTAALAAFIGSRLPQSHHASVERILRAEPEVVWRTLTDVDAFPTWRSDVKRVRRLPDRDGKPSWVEEGRSGTMTFVFERLEPPRVLVSRIADRNLPFGGTWTMEIAPAEGGARLKISEDGEIYNPIFRFMARFVFGYDGTINGYLSGLERTIHGI